MGLMGKRLLYIGGSASINDIAAYTNANGIHLLTAGKVVSKEVLKLTEEHYYIDTSNKDELSKVLSENSIDGILVIGNEDVISCVVEVTEKLGIPFYVNKNQWEELQNKEKFKKNCKLFNIPVVDTFEIAQEEDVFNIPESSFPIVLKPTDGCSSKGITVCSSKKDLILAIEKAKSFSRSGTFLCEKYMDCPEITIKYLFDQGEIYLWEVNDRYVNRTQKGVGAIANATVYPSKYLRLYTNTMHEKVAKMLKHQKMYNGTMFIQAFVDGNIIRPYDPGIRFSGGLSYFITKHVFNINPLEFMINASLIGKMSLNDDRDLDMIRPDMNGKHIGNYSVLLKCGKIANIKGIEKIRNMPEVFKIIQLMDVGDSITMIGTLSQVFARFFIEASSRARLNEIMNEIHNSLDITDISGRDLKLPQIINVV